MLFSGIKGVNDSEQRRVYKKKEKEFLEALNQQNAQQNSLALQHDKAILGQDYLEDQDELYEASRLRREQQMEEYLVNSEKANKRSKRSYLS